MRLLPRSVWLIPVLLVAAAAYELALALGAWGVGALPGEGPPGEDWVTFVAILAMLAGAVLAPLYANLNLRLATPLALCAPGATSFLAAVYYTYDPYYAPHLRRYSEAHASATWTGIVLSFLGVGLAVGLLTRFRPRLGSLLTSVVLVLTAIATVFVRDGH